MDAKQMFPLSQSMKDALGQYASEQNMSIAAVIRTAIAKEIDYPLDEEPSSSRRKYASPEERKAAQKARNKEKAALVKQLLEEYRAQQA